MVHHFTVGCHCSTWACVEKKSLAVASLTTSKAGKSSPAGETEHATEDGGIIIIPIIVTDCPPVIVIVNFSSTSVGATHDPDDLEGSTWTRTYCV